MRVDTLLQKCRGETQSRAARTLMAVGAALALCLPFGAMAQTKTYCGPDVKEYVAKTVASMEGAAEQDKLSVEAAHVNV